MEEFKKGGGSVTLGRPQDAPEPAGVSDYGFAKIFEAQGPRQDAHCILCRGAKRLCGKLQCPILVKFYHQQRTAPLIDSLELSGASPPGIFVGRTGYPKVYVGPLIPPQHGDTSLFDTPELWLERNISIEDLVSFRFQLVRGKHLVDVHDVESGSKIVDLTRELALCAGSAEVEARFEKKPAGRIALDDEVQPFGPSALLKSLDVDTMRVDARIDKAYQDTNLKAGDAILELYKNNVLVSKIQRVLSAGCLGEEKRRKFVPTRWSITAVDDTIGKTLVEKIKNYPQIGEYRVYESWTLDNRFIALVLPQEWSYELIEAWYPNTLWNPSGRRIVIFSSAEGYHGRTEYAEIGGCYYAARLAVAEALERERRQASAVILREAHSGYIMPVGVWNVRENVRNALRGEAKKFGSLSEAFAYIKTRLDVEIQRWIMNSSVLKNAMYQRRLEEF